MFAKVDHDRLVHEQLDPVEVERAEGVPFGQDDQGVGARRRLVGAVEEGDVGAGACGPRPRPRGRRPARAAPMAWSAGTMSSAGLSRMSSVSGLKVRPSTPIVHRRCRRPEGPRPCRAIAFCGCVVDRRRGLDQARGLPASAGGAAPGPGCLLGKAGACRSRDRACRNLGRCGRQADPASDLLDVGAHGLAKVGHLVDEGDLERQKALAARLVSSLVRRRVNRMASRSGRSGGRARA
jgi:hypothetical protein